MSLLIINRLSLNCKNLKLISNTCLLATSTTKPKQVLKCKKGKIKLNGSAEIVNSSQILNDDKLKLNLAIKKIIEDNQDNDNGNKNDKNKGKI